MPTIPRSAPHPHGTIERHDPSNAMDLFSHPRVRLFGGFLMTRIFLGSLLFSAACLATGSLASAIAADQPKDSPQAELTRTHKLKVKVSLKFKQEQLKLIFEDINSQVIDNKVDGKKLTKIRFVPDTGISFNSRMDIDVKDVTLEAALDKLLKQNDYGYIVISGKPGEQNDGAVKIVKGENRGYATAPETKKDKK
jgi:hypothetical protein